MTVLTFRDVSKFANVNPAIVVKNIATNYSGNKSDFTTDSFIKYLLLYVTGKLRSKLFG